MSEITQLQALGVTELAPDRLYAISSPVALDGRVSWAPRLAGRYQPINCYLAREGEQYLLIDTGVAAHGERTVAALRSVVPRHANVSVVLTRAELDCVSGLGAVGREFAIDRLLAGGAANPFDAFQEASRQLGTPELVGLEQPDSEGLVLARTSGIELGAERHFDVITPMLRLLATFWIRDRATSTLFTSDLFGHTDLANGSDPPVIDSLVDEPDQEAAERHLLAKYWWLTKANRDRLADATEALMDELEPETLAPTHGCILRGRAVVRQHVQLVLDVLRAERLGAVQ